jgi:magnesium transporter
MLRTFYGNDGVASDETERSLEGARWVDLLDPTEEEVARVAHRFGLEVPSRASLAEIEASSRTRQEDDRLVMSAPLIRQQDGHPVMAPVGFILMPDMLVTIRFADYAAFDAVHQALAKEKSRIAASEIMVHLLEEVVDRAADRLERAAETLAQASHDIFSEPEKDHKRHKVGRETRRLQGLMIGIGRTNEELVKVRHCFLSIGRIAGFLLDRCEPKLKDGVRDRLKTVQHDIQSLDEFENSLASRVSLLLDAAIGFIGIEQNDVVRLLTVVSVAGVPPVLIAGVYGMNFKLMPELDWHWGYPFALLLMVLSTLLPVWWFKWRDWL